MNGEGKLHRSSPRAIKLTPMHAYHAFNKIDPPHDESHHACSAITTCLRSALGLLSPARVCFRLRSSLTRPASSMVLLSSFAFKTGLGRWRRLKYVVMSTCKRNDMKTDTYRDILPTSISNFHRSLSVSRYSIAARSRVSMMPIFSDALAFHNRTFPSSDPDKTNRASGVNTVLSTLHHISVQMAWWHGEVTIFGHTSACALYDTLLVSHLPPLSIFALSGPTRHSQTLSRSDSSHSS